MTFWIARNYGKWGGLYLYRERPIKKLDGSFQPSVCDPYCIQLNGKEFPEVTFENSPQQVELKLKNELSFEETEELIDDLI